MIISESNASTNNGIISLSANIPKLINMQNNSSNNSNTNVTNGSEYSQVENTMLQHRSFMQLNGRKVLMPPENWCGPVPSSDCELFVRRIPKDFCDEKLMTAFSRFGSIYELRIPMDFTQANRGFAYVKYTNEEDAICALEVLSHYYIMPGVKLQVLRSYARNRLFISNIPKKLSNAEVEQQLRSIFPSMKKISTRGGGYVKKNQAIHNDSISSNESGNHNVGGFVIIDFSSHNDALNAKKSTAPGLIRLWGRDVKVSWAYNGQDTIKKGTTLFVRNVDLTVNTGTLVDIITRFVPRELIQKVSKVRNTAFFNFHTKQAAEHVLQHMHGTIINGQRLTLEWARPSSQQSIHQLSTTDFDATLRVKCIANFWQIPIIIFGTYYHLEGIQYAAVILRKEDVLTRAVFCALKTVELSDIHSRLCEVVNALIESLGGFPQLNYLIYVESDSAHILGTVTHGENITFHGAQNVPRSYCLNTVEISDISWAVASLSPIPEEMLLAIYYESFRSKPFGSFIPNVLICGQRIFGTIVPNYRNREPLKYNLNDAQIILALCYMSTGNNVSPPNRAYSCTYVHTFETSPLGITFTTLKLLPINLVQSRHQSKILLSQVVFDGNKQLVMPITSILPDLHPKAVPYKVSIKNPINQDSLSEQTQQQLQLQLASQDLQTESPIVQPQPNQNIQEQLSQQPQLSQSSALNEALTGPLENLVQEPSLPIHQPNIDHILPSIQQPYHTQSQTIQQEPTLLQPETLIQSDQMIPQQESLIQQQQPEIVIQQPYSYQNQYNYQQPAYPIVNQYVLFDNYNPYVFPTENGSLIGAPIITYTNYTNN